MNTPKLNIDELRALQTAAWEIGSNDLNIAQRFNLQHSKGKMIGKKAVRKLLNSAIEKLEVIISSKIKNNTNDRNAN